MFLLSFFAFLPSHVESNVCLPTVDVPFVCVCVYMFGCVRVYVTLLFVINQAIQFDFSANNGISKQHIYAG